MISMSKTMRLPPEFQDLDPVADKWARPTENARNLVRWSATSEEFAELYDKVMPRLEAMLGRLSGSSLEALDGSETNLFYLAVAFAEAAPHHELYGGSSSVPHSFAAERFRPMHGADDSKNAIH